MSIEILQVEPLGKGKSRVTFDNGTVCLLYRSELRSFSIHEGEQLTEEKYEQLLSEVIGKRAKKRAMHLLERMDCTEKQLRKKLLLNEYPESCVEAAIAYVKSFHYLDDYRYACNFVRYANERLSRGQLMQKLLSKGVSKDLIEAALEEEYQADELEQIQKLLIKRNYSSGQNDQKEMRRTYQFLLRRGFQSNDILKAMKS
jgi:regulatory protein